MRRALAIGGLDPSCGAGLTLDAFVLASHGYAPAMAATVITAQGSAEFAAARPVEPGLVIAQIRSAAEGARFDCIKIGAVGPRETAEALAGALAEFVGGPVVLDPVVRSSSGGALTAEGLSALEPLLPLIDAVTPNAEEAAALAGTPVRTVDDAASAARALVALGVRSSVVTGLSAGRPDVATDVVCAADETGVVRLEHPVISSAGDVRGTGCAFASALAARLGADEDLAGAVTGAQADVLALVQRAVQIGRGRRQVALSALVARHAVGRLDPAKVGKYHHAAHIWPGSSVGRAGD